MLKGIDSLRDNNLNLISQMQKILDEEEAGDTALRTQHSSKWNRMPSSSLNATFKQTLTEYEKKVQQAATTDE